VVAFLSFWWMPGNQAPVFKDSIPEPCTVHCGKENKERDFLRKRR
jgi:hypothetical protein